MSTNEAVEKEQEHVHKVYQDIAQHFSSTRYKPWPIVENFLKSQIDGSVGLDIGCGNGKYIGVNPKITLLGSDRSSNLVEIANNRGDALVADGLFLPYSDHRFDFAISIAVVHHFATEERRIEAVQSILSKLRQEGTALIYVWALEQKNSRRGWDAGMDQDVMVPWVTKSKNEEKVNNRYYHLYKEGEIESNVDIAGGMVVDSGYERDNWWCICKRK